MGHTKRTLISSSYMVEKQELFCFKWHLDILILVPSPRVFIMGLFVSMAARMKADKKADRAIYLSLVATRAYGISRALNDASRTQIMEVACVYLQ